MKKKVTKLVVLLAFMLFLLPTSSFAEKIVVIDPGHGGKFTSTCGYSGDETGFCEKDANLLVALRLRDILRSTDIKVHLTRSTDKEFASYLRNSGGDFDKRMEIANNFAKGNNDNSIFISIHHNQDPADSLTRGIETYYYDGVNHYNNAFPPDPMQLEFLFDSKRLAEDVHPRLIRELRLNDRELRYDQSFYVLRNAQMPAILVELGFMTNPTEEQLIKSSAFHQNAAQALADSVINYFNVFEVFDANKNKLKTFTEKINAISYAKQLNSDATVFDKNKQKIIFPTQPTISHQFTFPNQSFFSNQPTVPNQPTFSKQLILPNLFFHSNQLFFPTQPEVPNQSIDSYPFLHSNQPMYAVLHHPNRHLNKFYRLPGVANTPNSNSFSPDKKLTLSSNILTGNILWANQTEILATSENSADDLFSDRLCTSYQVAPTQFTKSAEITEPKKRSNQHFDADKISIFGGPFGWTFNP